MVVVEDQGQGAVVEEQQVLPKQRRAKTTPRRHLLDSRQDQ